MKQPKRGCLTCRHATYLKTPTGRIKKGAAVTCHADPPSVETVVEALKTIVPASMMWMYQNATYARGIWPEDGHDGKDCCAWAPKEKQDA